MITLKVASKEYKIASEWKELNSKKFLEIAGIRTLIPDPNCEEELLSMRLAFFLILSNCPLSVLDRIPKHHWAEILQKVNWCFEIPQLRDNPIPILKRIDGFLLRKTELIGPVGLMTTSPFSEFMAADEAFIQFHNLKSWSYAWLLLAILWRPLRKDHKEFKADPKVYNGDLREPFNIELCEQRAVEYEKRLPLHFASAVLLFFESLRFFHIVQHPVLKILFKGEGSSGSTAVWLNPLLQISNTKFGTFKETSEEHFFIILYEMANQMHEANRRAEEAKKLQNQKNNRTR